MEKASVIIPCYNDGRYLEESVNSALSQSYRNLEVVLVDDGSDDPLTQEKISQWQKHPRVRVVHGEHKGVAAARNLAISHATGEYILPLDADDLIERVYVEKAVPLLAGSPHIGIVYCRADYFGAKQGAWDLAEFSMGEMLSRNMIFSTALFRKRDWERVGGYCEELRKLEDWDFWLSLLELGLQAVRLDETLFHYRQHADASSLSSQEETSETILERYRKIRMRHIPLYQRNLAAYCDWVVETMFWYRWRRDEYACKLERELEKSRNAERQLSHALTRCMADLEGAKAAQLHLSPGNRWVVLSEQIPWKKLEDAFRDRFPRLVGRFSSPVRLALGLCLLQMETGLSDEMLVPELQENPYMQYFCGLVSSGPDVTLDEIQYVHEQMTEQLLDEMNAIIAQG